MSEEQLSQAWLEDETGRRLALSNNFTIGRAKTNTLVLSDPEQLTSQYHARLEQDAAGNSYLEDRHSTNGTFVNERKITRRQLADGDEIRFGSRARFFFRQPRARVAAPAHASVAAMTSRHFEERECWVLIGDIKGSSELIRTLESQVYARLVTDWAVRCREIAEGHGGIMASRTGDGWFLIWEDRAGVAQKVAATILALGELQRLGKPPFRMLVHRGRMTLGGNVRAGEDNVLSAEMHRAFRMEKIAAKLGANAVASEAAAAALQSEIPCHPLPGEFELPGFTGLYRFFALG